MGPASSHPRRGSDLVCGQCGRVLAGWVGLSQDSAYTCSECRRQARQGVDTGARQSGVSESLSDAALASEMRDAGSQTGELPLAGAQRRLGKRDPKPSLSRWARYRRRHPDYVKRERTRLGQTTPASS